MRLTDRAVKALKPKAARYEAWEDGRTGLGVRVSLVGRKSWVFMYRFGGKARRMTLGTYPALGLADARVAHAKAKQAVAKGVDPGAEKIEQRIAERGAETVADLAEEYLEKWARPRKRSAAEDERILNKDVLPAWGKRKAKEITRREVILLLDKIVERGSPIAANRCLSVVRKMFNFAISRDILDTTPVAMVRAPSKENQRDRVLTADEIRTLWHGLDRTRTIEAIKLVLKLELVTAQRKGEVAGAALSEFDLEDAVWTIPAARVKNGKTHCVPLSAMAVGLIKEARELADKSDPTDDAEASAPEWLFPSPRGAGPINPASVNLALRRAQQPTAKQPIPSIKLDNVVPHDLRRTAASGMTALGINRLTVAKILNHTDGSVTGVYDRYSYDAEQRHALDAWAAHLEGIVTCEPAAANVVPLSLAAGNEPA